ncbi:hypothetical protein EX30DRAFT_366893 [Ascodesmis nigricans]|uniref:Myb-like domain-containing protein n=1 Tax=Ascodesmis nigricans TaxID=341454 RepID=A0A4S2MK02_9PEZI|nr:hypothetical protein EX30DRAFT_366893 [Ascodesmis nigricans]
MASYSLPPAPSRRRTTTLSIRTSDSLKSSSKSFSPFFPPAPPPSPSACISIESLSIGLPVLDFADCDLLNDTLPERFIPDMTRPSEEGCSSLPCAPPPTPARKMSCLRQNTWTAEELEHLMLACESGVELEWEEVSDLIPGRSASSCAQRYEELCSAPSSPFSLTFNLNPNEIRVDTEINVTISDACDMDLEYPEEPVSEINISAGAAESDLLYTLLSSPPPLSRGPSPASSPSLLDIDADYYRMMAERDSDFEETDGFLAVGKRRRADTGESSSMLGSMSFPLFSRSHAVKRCKFNPFGSESEIVDYVDPWGVPVRCVEDVW